MTSTPGLLAKCIRAAAQAVREELPPVPDESSGTTSCGACSSSCSRRPTARSARRAGPPHPVVTVVPFEKPIPKAIREQLKASMSRHPAGRKIP